MIYEFPNIKNNREFLSLKVYEHIFSWIKAIAIINEHIFSWIKAIVIINEHIFSWIKAIAIINDYYY